MTQSAMVIVGAGECGTRAAAALRAAGWSGPIELIGAEPHEPYERPPLSKAALIGSGDPSPVTVHDEASLRAVGVRYRAGVEVVDIDRDRRAIMLDDGTWIHYQALLLATGANARQLPSAAGVRGTRILRTCDDALRLRADLRGARSVTVVGAGLIGLEVAAAAAILGAKVTVLEAAGQILGRAVPAEVAGVIHDRHQSAGVDVRCQVSVTTMSETASGVTVDTSDGRTFEADVVVIGIGATPNVALAEKAGLDIDNGISVDRELRTNDPHIFAAGDCCSFPHRLYRDKRIRVESWRNASAQGQLAAENMCGAHREYDAAPWFWSDQYDLTLQVVGLPDQAETVVRRQRQDGVVISFGVDGAHRLVSAAAVGTGNAVARDIRLAEMAINKGALTDAAMLADPGASLKLLLGRP
ncbi:NAD(P)/FAD-dependent oxidoreductase [Mycolicibacterium fluoranthenivorans]|nr:FAD-dependent oxidoreductase [Mycolicibacterium fluoranthenivorans]